MKTFIFLERYLGYRRDIARTRLYCLLRNCWPIGSIFPHWCRIFPELAILSLYFLMFVFENKKSSKKKILKSSVFLKKIFFRKDSSPVSLQLISRNSKIADVVDRMFLLYFRLCPSCYRFCFVFERFFFSHSLLNPKNTSFGQKPTYILCYFFFVY